MLSVWLVFCDCGFHSVCTLMDEDKRFVELPDGKDLLWWPRSCSATLFFFLIDR